MKAIIGYTESINGEVIIHGSKNAALPIIASTILLNKKISLSNVPHLKDIDELHYILNQIGIEINKDNEDYIYQKVNHKINDLLLSNVKNFRASYYLWGAILNNKKILKSNYPGGCNFQDRPLDIHFKIFNKFGYKVNSTNDYIEFIKTKKSKKYLNIHLEKKSFGATINAILLSIKSNKKVKIYNYSNEVEVIDFINFLCCAGAKITIKETHILIHGVKHFKDTKYTIMQDRIEAGSYIFLSAAYPNSTLLMKYNSYKHLKNVIDVFIKIGGKFLIKNEYMIFLSPDKLNDINLIADVYPAFPTDLQQIICSTLLSTNSKVIDFIYPNRISHIKELRKLNANITFLNNEIIIKPSYLENNKLNGIDLRGTFALIIASGKIKENTEINNVDNLFRGYSDIEKNLNSVGFNIKFK